MEMVWFWRQLGSSQFWLFLGRGIIGADKEPLAFACKEDKVNFGIETCSAETDRILGVMYRSDKGRILDTVMTI